MPHLARIKTRRDAVGKKTRLKLRGAAIDSSKVDRWIRTQRKKMGDEEFISSLATDGSCFAASPFILLKIGSSDTLPRFTASTPPDIGYETPDDHDSDDNDTTPSLPEILDTQNKAISESTASSTLPSPPTRPKAFRLIEKFEEYVALPPPISVEFAVFLRLTLEVHPHSFIISTKTIGTSQLLANHEPRVRATSMTFQTLSSRFRCPHFN